MTQPPFIQSKSLSALDGIRHGFFGRQSSEPDTEPNFNVSESFGQHPDAVAKSRHRALMAAGLENCTLAALRQTHSTHVATLAEPPEKSARPEADGLVTALPGIALAIVTADCAPILFADPKAGVIGACHAGWRGAVAGILGNTIVAMQALGARPERITAAVGPTISFANYEVGEGFAQQVEAINPRASAFLAVPPGGTKIHFDLPGFIAAELQNLGLIAIETLLACTYASPARYFSHRHFTHFSGPQGRQISLIGRLG